jgi:hypothetical protein
MLGIAAVSRFGDKIQSTGAFRHEMTRREVFRLRRENGTRDFFSSPRPALVIFRMHACPQIVRACWNVHAQLLLA